MKYKEGQQGKVLTDSGTGKWNGHLFKIGEVVTISDVTEDGYRCVNDDGKDWFLEEDELTDNLN
jgi:hypothetical protein